MFLHHSNVFSGEGVMSVSGFRGFWLFPIHSVRQSLNANRVPMVVASLTVTCSG